MLRNCYGTQKQRLMSKFVENDMEKVDRLMEHHFKYMENVEKIDSEIDERVKLYWLNYLNFNIIMNTV